MSRKVPKMLPMEIRKENLAVAYSILGGIPPKHFNLSVFSNMNHSWDIPAISSGTTGCSLGWLSLHPYFTEQGLFMDQGYVCYRDAAGAIHDPVVGAEALFGKDAWSKYFDIYGRGTWDEEIEGRTNLGWPYPVNPSQQGRVYKKLALARIKRGYKRIH